MILSVAGDVTWDVSLTNFSGQSGHLQEREDGSKIALPKRHFLDEHNLSPAMRALRDSDRSATTVSIFVGAATTCATSNRLTGKIIATFILSNYKTIDGWKRR